MKIIITLITCTLLLFTSCKRDTVTTHDIKGMVFNNCTDSGLANVTVYLQDNKGLNLSTLSDVNGNFVFSGVKIHSSDKYSYGLNIPSKSGIGATTFEYAGFNGESVNFSPNEADEFFKLKVTPKYLNFQVFCNKSIITNANDSILFYCSNYVFHKNVPSANYRWGGLWYWSK
ncbi:MAG: hypothetical protein U0V03_09390 [Bacteroidia bacterium]